MDKNECSQGKDSAAPAFTVNSKRYWLAKHTFVLLSGEGFTESKHEHSADEIEDDNPLDESA
ncbi:hypothetical protein WDV93_13845 [Pantoea ananatis]